MVSSLGYTLKSLGVPTDDTQNEIIHELVKRVVKTYFYFNVGDVILCYRRAIQAPTRYGNFYGKLDVSIIMNWFSVYDKERDEVIHSMPQEELKVTFTGDECSREEYIEILYAKIAGGDLYANEALQRVSSFARKMYENRYEYGKYKKMRKERLNPDKDILGNQRLGAYKAHP